MPIYKARRGKKRKQERGQDFVKKRSAAQFQGSGMAWKRIIFGGIIGLAILLNIKILFSLAVTCITLATIFFGLLGSR